jgi:hypothetical protein
MDCGCDSYKPLELIREAIDKRIRETRKIRRQLTLIAEQEYGEHGLYRCRICGQFWQISRAWNWGNYRYAFQVPKIAIEDWISKPYISPDDLLIFEALMKDFLESNTFTKTDKIVRLTIVLGSQTSILFFASNIMWNHFGPPMRCPASHQADGFLRMEARYRQGGASCPVMGAVFKTVSGCARAYLGGFDSHTPPPKEQSRVMGREW